MASSGGLLLFCYKGNTSWSTDLPAHEVEPLCRDPTKTKAFLMEALYTQVHPAKAKAYDERRQRIPPGELAHFTQRYERQEKSRQGLQDKTATW